MKINSQAMSERQRENFNTALTAYNEKSLVSSARPSVLYLELTRNCVSRCKFCRPRNFKNKPENNMDKDTFEIVMREYLPYTTLVGLNGWGENLTLPNFGWYISNIARFGPKIRMTTTLGCGTRETLQSLVDNDVFLAVSFDAADKRAYQNIRWGVKYNVVIRNLEFFTSKMLKKHGSLEGKIRLEIHPLQGENLNYVQGIVKLAEKLKIPEILLGPLGSYPEDPNLLCFHKKKTLEVFRWCIQHTKETGIRFMLSESPFSEFCFKEKSFDRCCHPWMYGLINYEGGFIYCDHLAWPGYAEFQIGKIQELPPERLWNGERMQQVRTNHLTQETGKLAYPCMRCYVNGRYADHEPDLDPQFQRWLLSNEDMETKLLCI